MDNSALSFLVASPISALLLWPIGWVVRHPIGARVSHTVLVQILYQLCLYRKWICPPRSTLHIFTGMALYFVARVSRSIYYGSRDNAIATKETIEMVEKSNNPSLIGLVLAGNFIDVMWTLLNFTLAIGSDGMSTLIYGLHVALTAHA